MVRELTIAKTCVAIGAVFLLLVGLFLVILGLSARRSDDFHQLSSLLTVESNNFFDTEQVIFTVIITGLCVIFCGLSGCLGAMLQHHLILCGVATVGIALGIWLLIICLALHVFWKSQGPVIAKALNRMCGPGAQQMFEKALNCASWSPSTVHESKSSSEVRSHTSLESIATTAQPILAHTTKAAASMTLKPAKHSPRTTAPLNSNGGSNVEVVKSTTPFLATSMPSQQPGNKKATTADMPQLPRTSPPVAEDADSSRNLLADRPEAQEPRREGFVPQFMQRLAITYAVAMEAHLLDSPHRYQSLLASATDFSLGASTSSTSRSHITNNSGSSRRLYPGTAEEGLLIRACSRLGPTLCSDPCMLLHRVCIEPANFNPSTACVCDRSGPRARVGAHLHPAKCNRSDDNPMCEVDGLGRHLGAFCMLPTPQLDSSQGWGKEACFVLPSAKCQSGTIPADCGSVDVPCTSTGPCTNPDSRSKLYLQARSSVRRFVTATGILGTLVFFVAAFSCCICGVLHSGTSVLAHARSLAETDSGPRQLQQSDDEFG